MKHSYALIDYNYTSRTLAPEYAAIGTALGFLCSVVFVALQIFPNRSVSLQDTTEHITSIAVVTLIFGFIGGLIGVAKRNINSFSQDPRDFRQNTFDRPFNADRDDAIDSTRPLPVINVEDRLIGRTTFY